VAPGFGDIALGQPGMRPWCAACVIALSAMVALACHVGNQSPTPLPQGFDPAVYPAPVAFQKGVNTGMSSGCQDARQLQARSLSRDEALRWVNDFLSGDDDAKRRLADRAYWPLISPETAAPVTSISPEHVEVAPAQSSPLAALLTNACGETVVQRSQWVRLCPGPCETTATTRPSLVGNLFLISRKGHWLLWAAE